MKRPAGTPAKAAKRTPRAALADPLEDLKARLQEVELDATFNARTDPASLDDLYTLLVDMIAGITAHGTQPDEAFAKVKPELTWKTYLSMWLEQHRRVIEVCRKYAAAEDEVFYHADAVAAELERREKIAWRLWLCQRAIVQSSTSDLQDEGIRQHLQAFRSGETMRRAA